MNMPPPLEPEFKRPEEKDEEDETPRDVRGLIGKIKKLGLGDYLSALGAGLIAFREARQKRETKGHNEGND